eukprot:TRINITY_DN13251_c0_g1_i1.p1 TRINITY_DN13251_c0_g1~~TRINITY_DN13251_c0_g1_i1.p1  ORF type:complete len:187 (+),score=53.69 TRINITY_DN13251_c0_g1_i1:27-563(+)
MATTVAADHEKQVQAMFIENVDAYMAKSAGAESVLDEIQAEYRKLKYIEQRITSQKATMTSKLPEITRCLAIVKYLSENKESETALQTQFELSSSVWAEGTVKQGNTSVFLWLGANVMVEYSYEEALTLLTGNLEQGQQTLKSFNEQLDFVKDQITVTEVNIARVYNWDVLQKRLGKQ